MSLSTQQVRHFLDARTLLQSMGADLHAQWRAWLATVPANPEYWTPEQYAINQAYCRLFVVDSHEEDCMVYLWINHL